MNLMALGAPGVGKGTYSDLIAQSLKIPRVSTGDMFRENIKNSTPIGKKAKSHIDKGLLVPDEITIEMLKERIIQEDCKGGFLLDGFPRTIPQADAMKDLAKIDKVLNFVAPEAIIIDRLSGRRVCRKCGATFHIKNIPPKKPGICDTCGGELYQREDDKEEVIKSRIEEYNKKTAPLIEYYKEILFDVDVSSPYEKRFEVLESVRKHLVG
jgi:adenylate kinase